MTTEHNPASDPIPSASDRVSPFPEDPNLPRTDGETASQLEDPASQLQAELERFRDLALRAQADFENYRKRAAREKEDAIRYANTALLEKLLPVVDNFDLGMGAARQAAGADAGAAAILNGLSMVQKQLDDFLRENGVSAIDSVGEKFDPHQHEALGHEASAEVPEGHVVRQLRKGYKLKDRLLRPANVFVSNGAS